MNLAAFLCELSILLMAVLFEEPQTAGAHETAGLTKN